MDDLARRVIGAAIEVHRHLGSRFFKAVYQEALAVELRCREISIERQKLINIGDKEVAVRESKLDFVVGDRLIVELKAVEGLIAIHKAQVISYLRET